MLDSQPARRSALELYVDAGPLARDIGYAVGRVRLPEIPLMLLAVAAMAAVLAGREPATGGQDVDGLWVSSYWPQILFGGIGAVIVITGLCWSGPVRGRFGWILPALVRVIEYAFVIRTVAVVDPDAQWLAYLYLTVVGYHHTDTVARLRHVGRGPARWVYTAGLGYDGRMLVIGGLVLAGPDTVQPGLALLTAVLAVVYVLESVISWMRWWRAQPRPATSQPTKEPTESTGQGRRGGSHRRRDATADVAEWAAPTRVP
jgi:Family of unknown function (DUF5941)